MSFSSYTDVTGAAPVMLHRMRNRLVSFCCWWRRLDHWALSALTAYFGWFPLIALAAAVLRTGCAAHRHLVVSFDIARSRETLFILLVLLGHRVPWYWGCV